MKVAVVIQAIPGEDLPEGSLLVITEKRALGYYIAVDNDRMQAPLYVLEEEIEFLGEL